MKINAETKVALKTALLTTLFTVGTMVGLNYYFNRAWNLFGNSSRLQPFTVQESNTIKVTPDQSQIYFNISKTAATQEEAQKLANQSNDKIISDLKQAGVDEKDIKTNNYNTYPVYGEIQTLKTTLIMPRPPQSNKITGYTTNIGVSITISQIDRANTIIDIITKDGAENVSGPNYTVSEETQKKLLDQARLEAIKEAKQKAQDMAKAAGIHLGRLVSIQEGSMPYPVPMMGLNAATKADAGTTSVPTRLNPGENTVTATVTLSYETW